ncbi:MAG: hypothetical protein C5B55_01205 [Blastocatellia bacterium]|nr:MAG: hypothetical protein C5B55_01205 [Blastocatellia bacterium]
MSQVLQGFTSFLQKYELDSPGGLFQASLDQMSPELAHHLRLCAIPHLFSPRILMLLVPGLSKEKAIEECNFFNELPSVRQYASSLFAFGEDVRSYLFKQWLAEYPNEEFITANRRLTDHFASGPIEEGADADSLRINRVFHEIGADRDKGFEDLESVLRDRRQHGLLGECDTLIRVAREYESVLTDSQRATLVYHEAKLATDRWRWEEARRLLDQLIANPSLAPELKTKVLVRKGLLDHENRKWSSAIKSFKDALDVLKQVHDQELATRLDYRIKLDLGITYRDMGELHSAKELMFESLRQARRVGSNSGMALAYNSLGTLFRKEGEGSAAIKAYQRSLDMLKKDDDSYRMGQVWNNLGLAFLDERQWKKGEEALHESLDLKASAGDTIGLAKTYNNLMQVYRKQQLRDEALGAGKKALQYFQEVGDYYDMALVMRNLGRLHRSAKDNAAALKYWDDAIKYFERADAQSEAQALKEEITFLKVRKKRRIPWWAWCLYIPAGLIIFGGLLLFLLGVILVTRL